MRLLSLDEAAFLEEVHSFEADETRGIQLLPVVAVETYISC